MEYKKITYFFNFLLNQMKLFSIYLFCIALLTYHGLSMANNIIKDYEKSNFGEVTTDFSDEEKTANMLAYILADEILNENNTYQLFSRMSGNFDEDKRDLLVNSLENS